MKVFSIGDNLGSMWVSHLAFRKEQRSNPSLSWLMPNLNHWSSDEIFIKSQNINITRENFQEFYTLLDSNDGLALWKDTKDLIKDLTPPGVELHCIYSYGVPIVEQLIFTQFPNGSHVKKEGDGDGTVNIRSLELCKQWSDKQNKPVITQSFKRLNHNQILKDKEVVKYIINVVKAISQQSNDKKDDSS